MEISNHLDLFIYFNNRFNTSLMPHSRSLNSFLRLSIWGWLCIAAVKESNGAQILIKVGSKEGD